MKRLAITNWAYFLCVVVAGAVLLHSAPATAQEAEWQRLSQEIGTYYRQGRYADAATSAAKALQVAEKTFGPNHRNVASSLNNLAGMYQAQGLYSQAEPLFARSLAIREKILGPEHPDLATTLNNLAGLYDAQGRYAEAEPLYVRALAIREKNLGPTHPAVGQSLNNLASLRRAQGKYAEAGQLYVRALAIREKALGPDHPDVAQTLNNIAFLYGAQGDYARAEPLYKRSLAIREKVLGQGHPDVGEGLNNLAATYKNLGKFAMAEPLYKRALANLERTLGPEHPEVVKSLYNLAELYRAQSLDTQALALVRRASLIARQRIVDGGVQDSATREASLWAPVLYQQLLLLSAIHDKESDEKIADESLQTVQLAQASGTASAVAKMAARFSKGNDALARLVKQKQDAVDRRGKIEAQLVSAAATSPERRIEVTEQRWREELAQTANDIAITDAELTRRFPEYQELIRPEPVSVRKVQNLLRQGEAMLVYAIDNYSYAWVITKQKTSFRQLAIDEKTLGPQVNDIRRQMEFSASGRLTPVNVQSLHALFQKLFAPLLPDLADVKHIMVVPSGPLQSIPLAILISEPPVSIQKDADYPQIEWLAKRYALSVLPSVSSIQAFRQFTKTATAQEPFAGFGDPLIGEGSGKVTRGQQAKVDIAALFRNLAVKEATKEPAQTLVGEIADVEAIRRAPRLPETADELRTMAKALKTDSQSLWLQQNATETNVKRLDLSRYRILAFATHGVLAGEVNGVGEPGLILTPPKQGSLEDDGYLSAGEIAKLNLNADWVVLSACNTAASDGKLGAEGLSGLAKAFFYAGARSLLVSHWPVASEATVPLTTGMLREYQTHPEQGKAEAYRRAALSLMNTRGHPEYGHPLFWAPFVVVGEGGVRAN